MIADSALRWALTAVFAVAALLFVGAGRRVPGQRGVGVLHALASVGMIAMLWPAGMRVSPLLYVLVFTAGALYFAYLALFGFGLPHPVYHCTMMAAMALMSLLMAPNAGVPVATAQASGHHSAHLGHGAVAVTPPSWFTAVCVVLAIGFCAAVLWWFYLLVRGPKRPYADLLMALGMSAAFAVMAV
ncbi:DUF5134 domain-containing protein [Mycolicibacterium aubagnense]|uniref:DUF5134 domain-containing protein n=1 Tax=Mycolicibacterium aubagnense TaxID=319707 RepID=A0ABM7IKR1_9MYCO|nr:DUF5134 domain-containing protein [Mycolicibacterium aubagnense]TLH66019.1 hypothetical protein C1S80_09350 [Mycolicibacterium aubagnense]WGI31271.1 DUF5134 domain-containing protein [Mycolicibacterium aubagnense]BBX87319.1 DUF5134 domain-containing protein [Mycolicibacterium aubagnense]